MQRIIIFALSVLFVILLILAFNVRDLKDLGISKTINLVNISQEEITKIVFDDKNKHIVLTPFKRSISAGSDNSNKSGEFAIYIEETKKPKEKSSDKNDSNEAEPDSTNEPTDEPDAASKENEAKTNEEPASDENAESDTPTDSRDTKSDETPANEAQEDEEQPEIHYYLGSQKSMDLVEALAKLTVTRELVGSMPDEKLEAYGLKPPEATLEIVTKSGTRTFEIGNRYTTEPRTRIRDTQDGKIYVASMKVGVANSTFLNIFFGDKRELKLTKPTLVAFDKINNAEVEYNGSKKIFNKYTFRPSEEQYNPNSNDWRSEDNPEETNVMFSTWINDISRATIEEFVVLGNQTEDMQAKKTELGLDTPTFTVSLQSDDTVVERLEFRKTDADEYLIYSEMLNSIMKFPAEGPDTQDLFKNIPEAFSSSDKPDNADEPEESDKEESEIKEEAKTAPNDENNPVNNQN